MNKYRALERVLLSGNVDVNLLAPYHELDVEDLKLQLQLFRRKRPTVSVEETAALLK